MALELAQESFWFDKARFNDAERLFNEVKYGVISETSQKLAKKKNKMSLEDKMKNLSIKGNRRSSDWNCSRCRYSNFSKRNYCSKCGAPKALFSYITILELPKNKSEARQPGYQLMPNEYGRNMSSVFGSRNFNGFNQSWDLTGNRPEFSNRWEAAERGNWASDRDLQSSNRGYFGHDYPMWENDRGNWYNYNQWAREYSSRQREEDDYMYQRMIWEKQNSFEYPDQQDSQGYHKMGSSYRQEMESYRSEMEDDYRSRPWVPVEKSSEKAYQDYEQPSYSYGQNRNSVLETNDSYDWMRNESKYSQYLDRNYYESLYPYSYENRNSSTDNMPYYLPNTKESLKRNIARALALYPGQWNNVTSLSRQVQQEPDTVIKAIKSRPDVFAVSEEESKRSMIVALSPKVSVCSDYLSPYGCKRGINCKRIHMCRPFIMDYCDARVPCSYDHSFETHHNRSAIYHFLLDNIDRNVLLEIVKTACKGNVYPRVCQFYNKGACVYSDNNCGNLHICYSFVKNCGKCSIHNCKVNHNIYVPHCIRLLEKYGFSMKDQSRDIIKQMATALVSNKEKDKEKVVKNNKQKSKSYSLNLVKKCTDGEALLRLGAIKSNGLNEKRKRDELIESFKNGQLDVLAIGDIELSESGLLEGSSKNHKMWKGLNSGWVAWAGIDNERPDAGGGGGGGGGVALMLSQRLAKCVVTHGVRNSRIVWVDCQIGEENYAFVSACAPKSSNGGQQTQKFWKELKDCLLDLKRDRKVIVLGHMNAKVGGEAVPACPDENSPSPIKKGMPNGGLTQNDYMFVVGKYGVPGKDENGDRLIQLCREVGLFLANTYFEHKWVHRYSWRVQDGTDKEQKALVDYVMIDSRLRWDVHDAKVIRGIIGISDHFAVISTIKVKSENLENPE